MQNTILHKLRTAEVSAEEALHYTSSLADLIDDQKFVYNIDMLRFLQNDSISITYCYKKLFKNSKIRTGVSPIDEIGISDWDPLLLWFLPKVCCIREIESMVREGGQQHISSIGCGSGLLEYITKGITELDVIGYEINEAWWKTSYAPPKFIPHIYVDTTLNDLKISLHSHHAILFSYFNQGHYFRKYMKQYKGDCVIIIGPLDGNRSTDPSPLELLSSSDWKLCRAHVKNNNDLICCYRRNKDNS